MIAASTQCEGAVRYLFPECLRLINQAQYRTLGTAPASIKGNQTAFIALDPLAPNERAASTSGVPKATAKFIKDAQRPHTIASRSPLEVRCLEDCALGFSRNFPAKAQSITPNRTNATAPRTATRVFVSRCSRSRTNMGIRLPTAADVPKTTENASVIPIISTARPKKTWATPQPAPNPATSRIVTRGAVR